MRRWWKERLVERNVLPDMEMPEAPRPPTPDKITYLNLRWEILAKHDSFLDHVLTKADDLRDEMARKGSKLRQEQLMCAKAERDAAHHKKGFEMSKQKWTLLQAEKYELQARMQKVEPEEAERTGFEKEIKKWEMKMEKKKSYYTTAVEDNQAVKKMLSDVTGVSLPGGGEYPKIEDLCKVEASLSTALPESTKLPEITASAKKQTSAAPCSPEPITNGSRRPYTGKTRTGQTTELPDITDSRPACLPPLSSTSRFIYPVPPATPCKPTSGNKSYKHRVLPPIRGDNSVGHVPAPPQEKHNGPKDRLDWIKKRFI